MPIRKYGYAAALTLVIGIAAFCVGLSIGEVLLITAIFVLMCRRWRFRPALNVVIAEPLTNQEGMDQDKQHPMHVADAKPHTIGAAQDGQTRQVDRT